MPKAAEARDDVAMEPRIFELIGVAEHFIQRDAAVLIRQRLGMHEWQIEEGLQHRPRNLEFGEPYRPRLRRFLTVPRLRRG